MNTYPANECQLSDIERGRSCEAIVPLPAGQSLAAGEAILFAQTSSRAGGPPSFVKGGDSVLVSLTAVTDLGATDPVTGEALVRLVWEPLGRVDSSVAATARPARSRRSPGGA